MKASVPYHALKALSSIAPVNDIRYYLNGVFVESKKDCTILVVTNGHYLVAHKHSLRAEECGQDEFACILPISMLRSIKVGRRILSMGSACTLRVEDHRAFIEVYGGSIFSEKVVDGVFPNWRKVIPHSTSNEIAQINPQYVAKVYRALAECYDEEECITKMMHNGDGASVVVYKDTVAVFMPLRDQVFVDTPIPYWATES